MKKVLGLLVLGVFVLSAISAYAGGDQNQGDKGKGSTTRTHIRKNK